MHSKYIIVIPARAGSKRFVGKNKQLLNGLPLFMHSVNAAKPIPNALVVLSTDDLDIINYCEHNSIEYVHRFPFLALEYSAKQDVIIDACEFMWESHMSTADVVISLQANSPQVTTELLLKGINLFESHEPVNGCKEFICINSDGKQNGSIRIMTYKTVFQKSLSTYVGSFTSDLIDVHTLDDFNQVQIAWASRNSRV